MAKAVITCKSSHRFTISEVLVLILGTQINFLRGKFPEVAVTFFLFPETSSIVLLVLRWSFRGRCFLASRLRRYINVFSVERNMFNVESKTVLDRICL